MGGAREERRLGMRKREREWGEDRVLPLLTHIEQCLQHQSAIAPASLRDPRSATQPPPQPERHCAALLSGNNPTSATPCQQCNDITSEAQVPPWKTKPACTDFHMPQKYTITVNRPQIQQDALKEGVFPFLT